MDPAQQLAWLARHPVVEGGLPPYRRVSLVHWRQMGPEAHERHVESGLAALRAVPDFRDVVDVVRALGRAGHAPAVPLLARLWTGCPVEPVRIAAGHALFDAECPEADAALLATADDQDVLCAHLAAKAVLRRGPAAEAFERYARHEEAARRGEALAVQHLRAALEVLAPGGRRMSEGRWLPVYAHPEAPAWLRAEPRWGELAAGLCTHPTLGPAARAVLEELSPEARATALARAPQPEARWPWPGKGLLEVLTGALVAAPAAVP
jgi:hypothetical protein